MQKSIKDRVETLSTWHKAKTSEMKVYKKQLKQLKKENDTIKDKITDIEKFIVILRTVIETRHDSVIELINETVSSALKDVFNEQYEFKLKFDTRNKNSTAKFLLHTGKYKGFLPLENQGNSVKQIVGIILRIINIYIMDGENFCFVDEPLGGVEQEKQAVVGRIIRNIAEDFDIQIGMVSHLEPIWEFANNKIKL